MDYLSIVVIAIGLAMDAFAVAITCGLILIPPKKIKAIKIASSFGGFQALMPLLGWGIGSILQTIIVKYDHWVAFIILTLIGLHMLYESSKPGCPKYGDPSTWPTLFMLSLATSIDAFAVGISLAFLKVSILPPIIIIGVITFCITLFGLIIGHKLGYLLGRKMEVVGGLMLIGIGIRILFAGLRG